MQYTRTHSDKNGKSKTEKRYFISSERRNGKKFASYVRGHWGIENSLHWTMDIVFREDESRIRERTLADNISCGNDFRGVFPSHFTSNMLQSEAWLKNEKWQAGIFVS